MFFGGTFFFERYKENMEKSELLLSSSNQKCISFWLRFTPNIVQWSSALTRVHLAAALECKSNLYFKLDNKIIVIISI